LWKIERAILEMALQEYPHLEGPLLQQIKSAKVSKFENTGAGFFSTLYIDPLAKTLAKRSPLNVASGTVLGIEHGMGFLVFLENGRLSLIEGYCNAPISTRNFDFETGIFELLPWSHIFSE
jgi:hypothetical protein